MLRVKNWKAFQHYKRRNPPWVKLHKGVLDDPEFHALSPVAAKYLPLLWLVASEDKDGGGALPASETLAFRLRVDSAVLAEIISGLGHFIYDDASNTLATCYQDATPETETETETEAEAEAEARARKIAEPKPTYSTETKAMFMRLCGHEPIASFSEWQEAGWDDATIRKALAAAEATGKKVKASYVNAILRRWATDGVPETVNGKAANGKTALSSGLDAMLAIQEGKG